LADFPGQELKLSGSALTKLTRAVLNKGASFRFQAKGFSMSPFIRDKDVITISQGQKTKPHIGDVVAVINPINGALTVHRIVGETEAGILLKGDNLETIDGIFARNEIIGLVTNIERNGKKVRFGSRPANRLIAFFSRTGTLKKLILPLLRKLKNTSGGRTGRLNLFLRFLQK
jgi:hypothetical protein